MRPMLLSPDIIATMNQSWDTYRLTSIGCDRAAGTNTPTCSCSQWAAPTFNSVGAAVDAWIDHVISEMRRGPVLAQDDIKSGNVISSQQGDIL